LWRGACEQQQDDNEAFSKKIKPQKKKKKKGGEKKKKKTKKKKKKKRWGNNFKRQLLPGNCNSNTAESDASAHWTKSKWVLLATGQECTNNSLDSTAECDAQLQQVMARRQHPL